MAGGGDIGKALGSEVMSLINKGSNFGLDVQQAAIRGINGQATKSDVALLRKARGIRGSGSRGLKGLKKKFFRAQQAVFNIAQQAELAVIATERGEGVGVAQARFIQTLSNETDRFLKTTFVKRTAETVVKMVGSDPKIAVPFLRMLGRSARLGGAIAGTAMAGVDFAMWMHGTAAAGSNAISKSYDLQKALGIDPGTARAVRSGARGDIRRSSTFGESIWRKLAPLVPGMDLTGEEMSDKAAGEMTEKRMRAMETARKLAAEFGVDPGPLLAAAAARLGKDPSDLTPAEAAAALDPALARYSDPSAYMNDPRVAAEISKYPITTARFKVDTAMGFLEKDLASTAQKVADREMAARKMREARSPEENLRHKRALAFSDANWTATRSRHKAWSND